MSAAASATVQPQASATAQMLQGQKRPKAADEFAEGLIDRVLRRRFQSEGVTQSEKVQQKEFPVACERFGIGLSWQCMPVATSGKHIHLASGKKIDLDLQAVVFDTSGKLLDAVYYNNLTALGTGLTHSGDERTGEENGFDETVWVEFAELPASVSIITFVVACYAGGHLKDAVNGKFHLLQDKLDCETAQYPLEQSDEEVDLVCALIRDSRGGWNFRLIDEPAQDGQHFIDILEPTLGNLVRTIIPAAPRPIKAAFAMDKGAVVDFPQSSVLKNINVCLGWDTDNGEVDLDLSAILLDADGRELAAVWFQNLEEQGVSHSGDNLDGHGAGDDEIISFELEKLDPKVQSVCFVINIYEDGWTFAQVAKPYCRVMAGGLRPGVGQQAAPAEGRARRQRGERRAGSDGGGGGGGGDGGDGEEFCRYQLGEAVPGNDRGLLMARMFRQPGDVRWGFQAIGVPCAGQTYEDSMPVVTKYANMGAEDIARELRV